MYCRLWSMAVMRLRRRVSVAPSVEPGAAQLSKRIAQVRDGQIGPVEVRAGSWSRCSGSPPPPPACCRLCVSFSSSTLRISTRSAGLVLRRSASMASVSAVAVGRSLRYVSAAASRIFGSGSFIRGASQPDGLEAAGPGQRADAVELDDAVRVVVDGDGDVGGRRAEVAEDAQRDAADGRRLPAGVQQLAGERAALRVLERRQRLAALLAGILEPALAREPLHGRAQPRGDAPRPARGPA